ncbi:TetR/AcrR family transcriptional regulator C-terminal domain-containing protein [Tsukamurella sp. 8F]|uniref:TetR/AcrR family transcriptional regulator C-terminal domain-containing protein n=1 Tax=unclassified Tsukamurella TaxID=2633480 RepID=UPI0023B98630|nr:MULTISPECIES: TetR/AcrR family transcriptional regulator C-terminal domain-containing protein [unclassified Tsukamurella]MDF0530751.1 TetR/AcrR family transcriptional regulator C-terminal domain-containing protein [Tsukamurella sp. 8J]MDF0587952.1 TetR/AcrR family transcriptional regulator C-terminal domain-containing protein [Tsukamurella sp. 8F]
MATSVPARRATRAAGQQTRAALLRAAADLFESDGDDVPLSQICAAAGAHPNQVTYYFGSKEALFVEVACGAVLRAGRRAEDDAARTTTVRAYTQALVETLLGAEAARVRLFVEAMLLAGRRPEHRPAVDSALAQLYEAGERALMDTLVRTGWELRAAPGVEARAFWSAVFGIAVQKHAGVSARSLEDAVTVVFTSLQIPESVLDSPVPQPDRSRQ